MERSIHKKTMIFFTANRGDKKYYREIQKSRQRRRTPASVAVGRERERERGEGALEGVSAFTPIVFFLHFSPL